MGESRRLACEAGWFGLAPRTEARATATDEMLSGLGGDEGFAAGRDDETESGAEQAQCRLACSASSSHYSTASEISMSRQL